MIILPYEKRFEATSRGHQDKQENALDLFYSGIKAEQTKQTIDRTRIYFPVEVCADLLQGDYKGVWQCVDLDRDDQERTVNIVLAYVRKLRDRTILDKSDS